MSTTSLPALSAGAGRRSVGDLVRWKLKTKTVQLNDLGCAREQEIEEPCSGAAKHLRRGSHRESGYFAALRKCEFFARPAIEPARPNEVWAVSRFYLRPLSSFLCVR